MAGLFNGFKPNSVIYHDYGGSPENKDGLFNPYHALVFPDGSVRYRNPENPYAGKAPHAFAMNDRSLGLSYAGPVGSTPTPEAMRSLQQEYEKIQSRFPGIPGMGHGEAFERYKTHGDIPRPSRDGREWQEASWRGSVADLSQIPEEGLRPLALLPSPGSTPAPDVGAVAGLPPKPSADPASPPSPRMALGGPKPMPTDPQTGQWVPEEWIARRGRMADQLWGIQPSGGKYSWAEGLLSGLGSGFTNAGVGNDLRGNQEMQQRALQGAAGAHDAPSLARSLIGSGVPGLASQGVGLVSQNFQKEADRKAQLEQQKKLFEYQKTLEMELARQKQQQRWEDFQKFAGMGAQPAPAAAPGPQPPAGPMIMGPAIAGAGLEPMPAAQPAPSPPQPARRDGPRFDKATLGAAVAAGLISKEAADLLGDDPKKKWTEAYDAEDAKNIVKDFNEIRDSGRKAASQVANYDVIEALVKNPALLQGPGAERFSLPLRRAAEFFGVKSEGLSTTQVFQSLVNEMALQARNPAGGAGMPGSMSDADREFLRTMVPSLGNTPEGNAALVQIRKRIAQREVEVSRMAINYAKNNGGRLDLGFYDALSQWSAKNPLFSEKQRSGLAGNVQAPAAAAAPTEQAAPPAEQQAKSKAQLDAAPVGAIEMFEENGQTVRRKKRQDGKWERVGTGEEASLALQGIGQDIKNSPAAKFLQWLGSQVPSRANAAEPPIEGAP